MSWCELRDADRREPHEPDPNDAVTQGAKAALTNAYNNAAGQTPGIVLTELAGQTLVAGVYTSASGTFGMSGTLTLDGANNADSVFIFQTASTLITGGTGNINLIRGAQACNIFWKVGSAATLGAGSTLDGTVMAHDSISLGSGVTVIGRLLAGEQASGAGAVTLIHDTIIRPTCAATPTVSPSASASATPKPSANSEALCDAEHACHADGFRTPKPTKPAVSRGRRSSRSPPLQRKPQRPLQQAAVHVSQPPCRAHRRSSAFRSAPCTPVTAVRFRGRAPCRPSWRSGLPRSDCGCGCQRDCIDARSPSPSATVRARIAACARSRRCSSPAAERRARRSPPLRRR